MVRSIKEFGILQSLIVRPYLADDIQFSGYNVETTKYEILAGHNRWNGAKEVGLRKDSGTVKLFGIDREKKNFNEQIGYVMDSSYFYEKQTLRMVKNIISSTYQNWNENDYQNGVVSVK